MKQTRRKLRFGVRRCAANVLLLLCCVSGHPQQDKVFPDAPQSAAPLAADSSSKYDSLERFPSSPDPQPMTPKQKAILAGKGVIDPFNLLTIGGLSAISTADNSASPYGPGVKGWERQSGVLLTQDMTHEFVGTFLIPSLVHQDPHYHRMPNASVKRRVLHCIDQVFWTQGDNGKGMFNYATVVGSAIDTGISDAYVPYQRTGWRAASERYGVGMATDPLGNLISEFAPDVARHVNIHVVFVQRLIDEIAREEGAGPQ